LQVAVDRWACDAELVGDLLDGVRASAVGAELVVHVLGDLGLARGELGFLAAGSPECACGGGEGPSTRADGRPASRPRDHVVRALQKALLERLRAVDPGSTGTEHAIYDAHTRARINGDRVYIDISGPGAPPQKKARRTVRYAGIQTQVLSGDVVEQGYDMAR